MFRTELHITMIMQKKRILDQLCQSPAHVDVHSVRSHSVQPPADLHIGETSPRVLLLVETMEGVHLSTVTTGHVQSALQLIIII